MKKALKFEHHLAEQIRQGNRTTTWRIYDDKDISVNDELVLIDKVDPKDPNTWLEFANAKVDAVIEKRLTDVDDSDAQGHQSFESIDAMLAHYQEIYGPEVSADTPVKIVHFAIKALKNKQHIAKQHLTEARLYADGGSRGNPGPSASGFVILDAEDKTVVKKGTYLGITTNNQAEYHALKIGLQEAIDLHIRTVHVYMDSMLVVNQMKGIFNVKNRDLWPLHEAIKELLTHFEHVSFTHVPRELNKLADGEVNEVLDAAAAIQ
jgi:ribonuclease HI